jgi:hypothetical protein
MKINSFIIVAYSAVFLWFVSSAQSQIGSIVKPGSPAALVAAGTQSDQTLRPHWPLLVKMWRGEGPVPGVWLPSAFKGDPAVLWQEQGPGEKVFGHVPVRTLAG